MNDLKVSNENCGSMSAIGLNVAFEIAKHDALNEVSNEHENEHFYKYSFAQKLLMLF